MLTRGLPFLKLLSTYKYQMTTRCVSTLTSLTLFEGKWWRIITRELIHRIAIFSTRICNMRPQAPINHEQLPASTRITVIRTAREGPLNRLQSKSSRTLKAITTYLVFHSCHGGCHTNPEATQRTSSVDSAYLISLRQKEQKANKSHVSFDNRVYGALSCECTAIW